MSVMTITTRVTKYETVPVDIQMAECKHGIKPAVQNVYTGKKKKLNGAIATCGNEECLCYDHDPESAAKKWNRFHEKNNF